MVKTGRPSGERVLIRSVQAALSRLWLNTKTAIKSGGRPLSPPRDPVKGAETKDDLAVFKHSSVKDVAFAFCWRKITSRALLGSSGKSRPETARLCRKQPVFQSDARQAASERKCFLGVSSRFWLRASLLILDLQENREPSGSSGFARQSHWCPPSMNSS